MSESNPPEATVHSFYSKRELSSNEITNRAKEQQDEETRPVGRRKGKKPNYVLRRATAVAIATSMVGGATMAAYGSKENNGQLAQSYSSETGNRAIEIISNTPAERMFTGSFVIDLSKARVRSSTEVSGKNETPNIMDKLTDAEEINGVEIPKGTKFIEITWPIEKNDTNGRPQDWIVLAIKYKGKDEVRTGFVADSKSTREEEIIREKKEGIFSRIETTPDGKRITQVGQGIIMQNQMGKVTPVASE